jgi:hypothetical protein
MAVVGGSVIRVVGGDVMRVFGGEEVAGVVMIDDVVIGVVGQVSGNIMQHTGV